MNTERRSMEGQLLAVAFAMSLQLTQAGAQPLIDFNKERLAFRQSVTSLFEAGQTDALEDRARQLRAQRLRFSSGTPILFDFYEAFNPGSAHIPASAKESYAHRLLAWADSRPKSLVASMAAVKVAKYRAWKARGGGYANTVTDEGWKVFREHQLKAWSLMRAAEHVGAVDAALYNEMLKSCQDLEKPRAELDAILGKLVALDPGFDHAYISVANYLRPRWHGSAEELHEFALRATEQSRPAMGPIMYARIAIVVALQERSRIATDYPFEYKRLKEAFHELDHRYPNSGRTVNFYAWFALTYGDTATARPLMDRIAREWTDDGDEVWGGRTSFDRARASVSGPTKR
jgi:hypothetical protein